MNKNITKIFYPETVCVVGASSKEKSIGFELLKTIKSFGYTGKVFPVNPKSDEILGFRCYKNIAEINSQIDLAIIIVPKQFVESSIDELLKINVGSIILITAGFKETGDEGVELENRVINKLKGKNVNLVGPNCMGVINTSDKIRLNATFVAEKPKNGSIAFLSQSGALGAAVLNSLRESDIRFAHFISVGNKADLNENDFLDFWEKDDNIGVITMYLESFENGFGFIRRFAGKSVRKPVIVLKAGRTGSGMKAASSHTGALSGEDKVADAVLKQFGIIRADSLNEMFNTSKGFETFPLPQSGKVAVITNAGGPAILAVDRLEKEGLTLAELSDETKMKLRVFVNPEGSVNNPVDLLPGGTAEVYKKSVETVIQDRNVDAVISIFVEPVMVDALSVVEAVYEICSDKPIIQTVMPLPEFREKYKQSHHSDKPVFRNPEDPAEIISNMLFYKRKSQRIRNIDFPIETADRPNKFLFSDGYLSQPEIKILASDYNLPVCQDVFISALNFSPNNAIKYPVVIKGEGKNIIHKSEIGAVKINLKDEKELIKAAEKIKNNCIKHGVELERYHIQEYVNSKHELLIGGYRDAGFGPVIMFGSGGKYVEVYNDTAIKSAFCDEQDIDELLNETKIFKVLKGVRGEKSVNINELKNIILNCARLMTESPSIAEFDINPLVVTEENDFKIVDIRIKWQDI